MSVENHSRITRETVTNSIRREFENSVGSFYFIFLFSIGFVIVWGRHTHVILSQRFVIYYVLLYFMLTYVIIFTISILLSHGDDYFFGHRIIIGPRRSWNRFTFDTHIKI